MINRAGGDKQSKILVAEGEAQAIKLVNEAANAYFVGNAQLLKQLQTVTESLRDNSKIIIPSGQSLINVIGDLSVVVPSIVSFFPRACSAKWPAMYRKDELS